MSRRKDREYLEIDNPRVSVVLAGTPEQIRHLIPDAENGLLSRFIFYFIPFRRGIRDVFATDDVTRSKHAVFKILGDEFLHLLDIFMNQGLLYSHCQLIFNIALLSGWPGSMMSVAMKLTMVCRESSDGWDLLPFA